MVEIFISYAHSTPEHKEAVSNLVDVLRKRGFEVSVDTDITTPQGPEEGWHKWMKNQLRKANWVLIFFDAVYKCRFDGEEEPNKGLGATWEGAIITSDIYRQGTKNKRFIPLLANDANISLIPDELFSATRYHIPQQSIELAEILSKNEIHEVKNEVALKMTPASNNHKAASEPSHTKVEVTENIFVIFTDIYGSSEYDNGCNGDFITWRKESFSTQLMELLQHEEINIVKSIGDALFIKSTFSSIPSESEVKKLLSTLVNVFKKCSLSSKAIRITIHVLDKKYTNGKFIAEQLDTELNAVTNKSKINFISNLKTDIFGLEINKAAKIQALVKEPTIVVSDRVVELLNLDNVKEYNFDECILYSPTPITYLKGILDFQKDNPSYMKIWELSERGEQKHILAKEFKQYHTLIFLNSDVEFLYNIKIEDIEKINTEAYDKIFKSDNNKELLNFYTDALFEINDIFSFKKIDYTRPSPSKDGNTFFNFKKFKDGVDDRNDEIKPIKSLFSEIKFSKNSSNNLSCEIGKLELATGMLPYIPYLAISSFPNQEISSKLRHIYSSSNDRGNVKLIEPQTIQVYKQIIFDSTTLSAIDFASNNLFILVFFGVYNQYIHFSEEEGNLFKGLLINNIPILAKGLLPGLIDGFVIYQSSDSIFKNDLTTILNKLFMKNSSRTSSFYDYVFPISVFTLKLKEYNAENIIK